MLSHGQLKQQHATGAASACFTWENAAEHEPPSRGTRSVCRARQCLKQIPADPSLSLTLVLYLMSTEEQITATVLLYHIKVHKVHGGCNLQPVEQ